jgi:hypothetical protein
MHDPGSRWQAPRFNVKVISAVWERSHRAEWTDISGCRYYRLGLYRIRIEAAGYQAQEAHQVDLPVAGLLEYRFGLRLLDDVWEAGKYHSIFLPNSSAVLTFFGPDVDTSYSVILRDPRTGKGALESSISQVVDPAEVQDLPLVGRDVYTTLILQPGVAAGTPDARGLGLAVSGQRPTSSKPRSCIARTRDRRTTTR